MSTTKLKPRPELSINEASELFKCKLDDIVYSASIGEITLYVVAELWTIESIFIINPSNSIDELSKNNYFNSTSNEKVIIQQPSELLNKIKNWRGVYNSTNVIKNSESIAPIKSKVTDGLKVELESYNHKFWQVIGYDIEKDELSHDKNISNCKVQPDISKFCDSKLAGLQPVAPIVSFAYRNGYQSMPLLLDADKTPLGAFSPNLLIAINPKLIFRNLLNANKIFVKRDDFLELSSITPIDNKTVESTTVQSSSLAPEVEQRVGLETKKIAAIFHGIHWESNLWKQNLADCPKWLVSARLQQGRKGGEASKWDPVEIAKSLEVKDSGYMPKLKQAFKKNPDLQPWLSEWEEHLSNNDYYGE